MFGIVVYGTAVISVFYYLVPFRWYLLICRGKNYADGHQKYERYAMQILSDASNDFYAFKKAQDADASLISQSKFSNKYLSQIKRYWNRRLNFSDYNHQKHLLHSRYCLEIKIAYMIFIKEYWETSKRNFMEKRKISLLKNTHLNSPKQQEIFHYRVDQFQKNISNAQISINYYQTLLKNVKKGMII
jgi:hypothetical protein